MTAWLHVVGVGEGGVAQLSPATWALVANAVTVLGPPRLLAGLGSNQTLVPWEAPLERMIEQVKALEGTPTAILATGDPSWFGIGVTLSRFLPAEAFAITPHPSAFSLAAARLHWALQNVATLSLHGRADAPVDIHLTGAGDVRIRNGAPRMSDEELAAVRKRFARGRTLAAGSGLGLSIAERLLGQMQASLVLTSPIPGMPDGFQAEIVFPTRS